MALVNRIIVSEINFVNNIKNDVSNCELPFKINKKLRILISKKVVNLENENLICMINGTQFLIKYSQNDPNDFTCILEKSCYDVFPTSGEKMYSYNPFKCKCKPNIQINSEFCFEPNIKFPTLEHLSKQLCISKIIKRDHAMSAVVMCLCFI